MNDGIKKIVIVGRDLDAWITAFFLKSVLDKSRDSYEVTLVELGTLLTEHDIFAVLPSYKMLHKTLGANEDKLRQTAKARPFFGQRFTGWNPELPEFFHAYDRLGINFNGVDFFQYWMKAVNNGLKLPLEDFSLGVAAAKHGRFVASTGQADFSHLAYGYHLSAIEYVNAIARAAMEVGVKRENGNIITINRNNDVIDSLSLDDGTVLKADFFIDASGADALLINSLTDNNFESWEHWFLCDRIITASSAPLSPAPAFSQVTAFSSGWCGLYPLNNRTAIQTLYSSRHTDFSGVVAEMKMRVGVDISQGVERPIKCGMLSRPWIGNCLAVGTAAASMEPLDALQEHSLVISMVMLKQLFPNSNEYQNERDVYNKKMHSFIENLRDFQIVHYALNSRDELFWEACKNLELPHVLKEKIDIFKCCGYASVREDETFQEENWISVFNGHGLAPEFYSPLVDNMSDDEMIQNFQKILRMIKERITSSPLV